ncbi:integrator complex subunit 11 [Anaeramoeba flamelloides]|uniref:Integrator complex subunit 11 n=1 Tax=Anaeramoeba flamelloides TaxID=1746091 RepID=A0ABQ8YVK3_9EUKA|nr:integrator complex subunit 11 [Anaeramoeba flamelloides]
MEIRITPLGAGQFVGKSCILIQLGPKTIMLDCGGHMGLKGNDRFPDFQLIPEGVNIDLLIISHFHLDHCAAMPILTEKYGYDGPIVMTPPTLAIIPLLLEDFLRVSESQNKREKPYTREMIHKCMSRVTPVNLHQSVMIDDDFEIIPFYAGHVLGAAMFYVRYGHQSAVYSGDFSMTSDRHLGCAKIKPLKPDVLITETTYGSSVRNSKSTRERNFLKRVQDCLSNGGKVLIPVFALGRAQELAILLETYWDRMGLTAPIYTATKLAEKANEYYRIFTQWTNEKIKQTYLEKNENIFDFKYIKSYEESNPNINGSEPMVILASPGMLHGGKSLEILRNWCSDEKNLVIIPGYCVKGTVGAALLSRPKGEKGRMKFPNGLDLEVNCTVIKISFSAHADKNGILSLITQCKPKNVICVHGDIKEMKPLSQLIKREFKIPSFCPKVNETISIPTQSRIPIRISRDLLKNNNTNNTILTNTNNNNNSSISGTMLFKDDKLYLLKGQEAIEMTRLKKFTLNFVETMECKGIHLHSKQWLLKIQNHILSKNTFIKEGSAKIIIAEQQNLIKIKGYSLNIQIQTDKIILKWSYKDEDLAMSVISFLQLLIEN